MSTFSLTGLADLTLTQRLNVEASTGVLDVVRAPVLMAVPSPIGELESLRRAVAALKMIVDQREGVSGSVLDKHLTLRDLMREGALGLKIGQNVYTGTAPSVVGLGSGYRDPRPVLSVPATPTNLTAQGAFRDRKSVV